MYIKMTYSSDIAQKLVLFHYATMLLQKMPENEKLKEFCFNLGKELATDASINIEDIINPEKIADIKLSEDQTNDINNILNELK